MPSASSSTPLHVCSERISGIHRQSDPVACVLANGVKILLPRFVVSHIALGDNITFPIPEGDAAGAEIYIEKAATSGEQHCIYQTSIGYVSQPKLDRKQRYFVSAQVQSGRLGISTILLPCPALSEYFYRLPRPDGRATHITLYEILGIAASASPAEMRLAFQLRRLELETAGARHREHIALERAFNIVAQPELRACYDALLRNREAPAIFPYGGFGSLLAGGERSGDGQTFFARCILAFLPERRRRHLYLPLHKCDFYEDRARCCDVGRKLEFWIDPALLHTMWDPGWNRWKHLLADRMEVDATFIQSGKYRKRGGTWELVPWERALASRITVKLPDDFPRQVEMARTSYHRFGQYSRGLEQIRLCLEYRALEKSQLEQMCSRLRIPADFDISQINWRPGYDPFFYRQLSIRARHIYLFRGEYIFDLEKAIVVETPQLGHASYVFEKARNIDGFVTVYTKTTKDDIRHNRDNIGERLGFLGRVVHGASQLAWLNEIRQRVGEKIDFDAALPDESGHACRPQPECDR